MNAELYIPIYGNYMQMKHMVSEEESERPFSMRARDAISSGIISGAIFGASVNFMPGKASVMVVQSVVETPMLPLAIPAALAVANFVVIESAPEEQQRGLWQMFSSALTGTFGGDYAGLV